MPNKILITDDEPNIVKLVKVRLESNGYEVITAASGTECINKIVQEEPDLVILDIMMPKMDGYDTLIAVKEMFAENEDEPPPVLIMTARADSRIRDMLENEEVRGYIIKPFKAEELLAKIKEILA
ncbi:MAG: response regulator transcription factor [bacterium]